MSSSRERVNRANKRSYNDDYLNTHDDNAFDY